MERGGAGAASNICCRAMVANSSSGAGGKVGVVMTPVELLQQHPVRVAARPLCGKRNIKMNAREKFRSNPAEDEVFDTDSKPKEVVDA